MEKSHSIPKCKRMEGGGESRKVFPLGKVVGSPTLEGGFMEEVSAFINQ